MTASAFVHDVLDELLRAKAKHPGEEGVLTDAEWLAVLTEEVGECARAIQDESDASLRGELVQVAAMAMRWALSIPHGRQRPPWSERAFTGRDPQDGDEVEVVRCTRDGMTCGRKPCCRRAG